MDDTRLDQVVTTEAVNVQIAENGLDQVVVGW